MKIYNALIKKKQEFIPLKANEVSMYVCGVTVYDNCHLGHARAYVSFDIARRYLEYKGYKVRYIQNFTDVDDKIIARANENIENEKIDNNIDKAVSELAKANIQSYFEDIDKLGVKRADLYPKATEHIQEMIDLILGLIDKGYAYEVSGDVYFEIDKFKEYGKLSGRDVDDLRSGARVEINENKRSSLDFVLWKSAKEGEPSWQSPWGCGRPGWHIECSAMAIKYLGETFDIHGGGQDLIFPHHENEIAQSECFTSKPFVAYWMHNGFLTINKEKMSKSLGNFFILKDIYKKFEPEIVRFFLISAHYRSPIDFSDEKLEESKTQIERGYMMLKNVELVFMGTDIILNNFAQEKLLDTELDSIKKKFEAGMDDDFNTAIAIACLFELVNTANIILKNKKIQDKDLEKLAVIYNLFNKISSILNIFQNKRKIVSINSGCKNDFEKEIQDLLNKRIDARAGKDWALADKLRDQIKEKHVSVEIEDTSAGTFISYKRAFCDVFRVK